MKSALRLALLSLAMPMIAQAQFIDPGDLNGGGMDTNAYGVSADGTVVVGRGFDGVTGTSRAFRWTQATGMVSLGVLPGYDSSSAQGVSADGSVVVGRSDIAGVNHAFRWTSGVMADLGTLGGNIAIANGVSADGKVAVGVAVTTGGDSHAFRWALGSTADGTTSFNTEGNSGGAMVDLGTLGGKISSANAVSFDGAVVVGSAQTAGGDSHAFRWTLGSTADGTTSFNTAGHSGGAMVDLGTLGGKQSFATGVSSDGSVVVGYAEYLAGYPVTHAFCWTRGITANGTTSFDTAGHSGGAMVDLGSLGGWNSHATGVSADGKVIVGGADINPTSNDQRAFRWTAATQMQTVEDWLRAAGVTVPKDITYEATATNRDGSVVVGTLANFGVAFIARVAPTGSGLGNGLVTLADVQKSLAGTAAGGSTALTTTNTIFNGAHSRPLARRVATGERTYWVAGDWGADDHASRPGNLGLAEAGVSKNFGPLQVNLSYGKTWARQNLVLNGSAKADGSYLLGEALVPVYGSLWATLSAYGHVGSAKLTRGYLNAGMQDFSRGTPDTQTWGARVRLDLDKVFRFAGVDFSPYVDLTYSEAKLDAYTESGGSFAARFDSRLDKATELRIGSHADLPLANGINVFGTLEAAHRVEKAGPRTRGQLLGLFSFDLPGQSNKQDWLRAGVGVEGKLGEGKASLALNATTQGSAPSYWLAASWQRSF